MLKIFILFIRYDKAGDNQLKGKAEKYKVKYNKLNCK